MQGVDHGAALVHQDFEPTGVGLAEFEFGIGAEQFQLQRRDLASEFGCVEAGAASVEHRYGA